MQGQLGGYQACASVHLSDASIPMIRDEIARRLKRVRDEIAALPAKQEQEAELSALLAALK